VGRQSKRAPSDCTAGDSDEIYPEPTDELEQKAQFDISARHSILAIKREGSGARIVWFVLVWMCGESDQHVVIDCHHSQIHRHAVDPKTGQRVGESEKIQDIPAPPDGYNVVHHGFYSAYDMLLSEIERFEEGDEECQT
jgi:hypothetical protein